MKSKAILGGTLLVLLGSSVVWAGDPWKEKPYTEWTEKECRKLLQNSPWAKRYVVQGVIFEEFNPRDIEGIARERETDPRMEYQVQLLSALPIRQALVRFQRTDANYDNMSPEQRQAFDQWAEAVLNQQFRVAVVLTVEYGSNVDMYDKAMARYWQRQTTETLKNYVFLRAHAGEEMPLLAYTAEKGAGRTFQLLFSREQEGRPLLRPDSKWLRLDFPAYTPGGGQVRAFVEFKVKRMLIEGEVMY